jgi:hypothetical protein
MPGDPPLRHVVVLVEQLLKVEPKDALRCLPNGQETLPF